jgi:transposase
VLAGETHANVAAGIGVAREVVSKWVALYRSGGWDALRRTVAPGAAPRLTKLQLQWLLRTISTKTPEQLQFPFALWTREIVRALIKRRWGITLGLSSITRVLRKLGLTPQKPMARAIERDPIAVRHWIKEDYPEIKALARKVRATIFFEDESGVRSDYHAGTTWAPKGVTPVVERTGQRVSCNMLSAVAARGLMRFMATTSRVTTDVFIDFCRRLIKGAKRPIFLIVDGHPTHRAKRTREFVESTNGKLRLFFLPPYAPDLNPDELVWRHVKTQAVGRRAVEDRGHLFQIVSSTLFALQKRPKLIRAFFNTPTTAYAAT